MCCAACKAKWVHQIEEVFEGIRQESNKAFLKHSRYLQDWQDFIDRYPLKLEDVSPEDRPPFSLPITTQLGHLVSNQGRISFNRP